ncbi:phosphotransferase family protein [Nocardia niwae]|uniref:Phosphotransferase family protein n=1 Tax=Nocardia niwae TaxID=626084 RepID=A0ABV2XCG8_9NOCA
MTAENAVTDVPGLDLSNLDSWLEQNLPNWTAGQLHARIITGGRSNLTYRVSDGRYDLVLRRPPMGHVLATAHDMTREYRVISALAPTAVPVPAAHALCNDPQVVGAPFYLMDYIAGTPYRRADELRPLGPARTRTISAGLIDTLAALHTVYPDQVGLGDFGRRDNFAQRQVLRGKKRLDASHCRELPAATMLFDLLAAHQPPQPAARVVHGDYRLDNLLVDAEQRVAAVLDWEMATLGDPMTDIGMLIVYQRMAELRVQGATDVAAAPGFLTEAQLLDRYAHHTKRDLTHLGFYIGLASFELAAILEGIHYRHLHGQTVGAGFDTVGDAVEPLLSAGLAVVKEKTP